MYEKVFCMVLRTVVLDGLGALLGAVGRDPEDLHRHVRVDRVALRAGSARLRQLLPADYLQQIQGKVHSTATYE